MKIALASWTSEEVLGRQLWKLLSKGTLLDKELLGCVAELSNCSTIYIPISSMCELPRSHILSNTEWCRAF